MTSTTSNPSILASNPPDLLPRRTFKPYFNYHEKFLSKLSKEELSKRNYRFIHSLKIPEDKVYQYATKIISKLKSVSSLSCPSSKNFPLWKKLIKSHQKSLRNLREGLETPRLQRYLPLLSQLEVHQKPSGWRLLLSRLAFTKLTFSPLDLMGFGNQNKDLFQKNKASLRRSLCQMKDLKSLEIKAPSKNTEIILSLLEIVNEKVHHLQSLKRFSLNIIGQKTSFISLRTPMKKPENVERALQSLTHLSIEDIETYSFLLSTGEFHNLSNLSLSYAPKEGSLEFNQAAHLKGLPNIKKFTLSFEARSSQCEAQFFENFSFPPTLEELDLTLTNFKWNYEKPFTDEINPETIQNHFKNNPIYTQFFEKLQGQNVKTLDLSITFLLMFKISTVLPERFASLFIQKFTKLEHFSFQTIKSPKHSYYIENQIKSLDLSEIWKALEPSKETLKSIFIRSEKISFPENIETLETNFPRLGKLVLQDNLLWPTELGAFFGNIPSLKDISLREVILIDGNTLKKFLLSCIEFPRGINTEMYLNVQKIHESVLINCLFEYVNKAESKRGLKVNILGGQIRNLKAFQWVLDMVQEKGCFEEFAFYLRRECLLFQTKKNVVCQRRDIEPPGHKERENFFCMEIVTFFE